jgi:hypothetical protein
MRDETGPSAGHDIANASALVQFLEVLEAMLLETVTNRLSLLNRFWIESRRSQEK